MPRIMAPRSASLMSLAAAIASLESAGAAELPTLASPAAAVRWIFFEMRLDLRHHVVERLVDSRRARARGQRKITETRRTERQVERHSRDRQAHQRHDRGSAAQTKVRPRRQVALVVR